jgi:hypothetical protein
MVPLPLDVEAVKLWALSALPLLSLTIAVIIELPPLETPVGTALTVTSAGTPALMVMIADADSSA